MTPAPTATYEAVPATRSFAPSRRFAALRPALAWARRQAARHQQDYDVWQLVAGRGRRCQHLVPEPLAPDDPLKEEPR